MNPSTLFFRLLLMTGIGIIGLGCDDSDTGADGPDGGTASDENPGAVLATGNWTGEQPDGVNFDLALFPCPFAMPPEKASLNNPVDPETGAVSGKIEDVPPGDWCIMAYIDMDPSDGLAPIQGVDALNATGQENDNGALPVTITSGKTTELTLTFEIGASD